MVKKLQVLDLFSGIGGFSLGLERAGMETVAFCEIDEHCQRVLAKHWPLTQIIKDVKTIKGSHFQDIGIDVICGGFPCQDISVAGKKKGLKGERSGLWFEFKRIIKEVRPKYVIVENVANLRNQGLNQILKDFGTLGYDCEWHIISARSIGACHLRERIWIIATDADSARREWADSSQPERRKHKAQSFRANDSSYSNGPRLEGQRLTIGVQKTQPTIDSNNAVTTNANDFRFWQPFTSQEEQSLWWTKTASGFRDWWKVESSTCRMDDGLSKGLDKNRKERIKQLGNSLLPQIPELIGRAIVEYENRAHNTSLKEA